MSKYGNDCMQTIKKVKIWFSMTHIYKGSKQIMKGGNYDYIIFYHDAFLLMTFNYFMEWISEQGILKHCILPKLDRKII